MNNKININLNPSKWGKALSPLSSFSLVSPMAGEEGPSKREAYHAQYCTSEVNY